MPRELADQCLGFIGVTPAFEQGGAHVIGPALDFEEHGQLLQETELVVRSRVFERRPDDLFGKREPPALDGDGCALNGSGRGVWARRLNSIPGSQCGLGPPLVQFAQTKLKKDLAFISKAAAELRQSPCTAR